MVWLRYLSILFPCGGLFVSGYLSIFKAMGLDAQCGKDLGCSKVALWVADNMGDFPVAYVGMFGYIVLIVLALYSLIGKKPLTGPALIISGIGTLISIGLMVLSFVVIKTTCPWCVASAILMTCTFLTHLALKKSPVEQPVGGTDTAVVIIGVVGAIAGIYWAMGKASAMLPKDAPGHIDQYILANPKMYGKADAEITILEFFSFTCPHCKDAFPHMKEIIDKSNGRARLIMVNFPFLDRQGHEMAAPAAAIGEMANEKGKFYEYAQKVFSYDTQLLDIEKIVGAAVEVGLDGKTIRTRLENANTDRAFKVLEQELAISSQLGVDLTPTYLVGRKNSRIDALTMTNVIPVLTGVRYGLPKPSDLEE